MAAAYPLTLSFKVFTVGAQIRVVDANGTLTCYVKQKAFKLKEDVTIFADEEQTQPLYRLKANKIIDIGATYAISSPDGRALGAVRQQGMRTFWKATYDILDAAGTPIGLTHEEKPWVKVLDGLVGQIPFVGFIVQRWINPTYLIDGTDGTNYLRLRKRPSLLERSFLLERAQALPASLEQLAIPSVLMVALLERGRG